MTKDLATESFLILRKHFFDTEGKTIPFHLRPKGTTQDDPFDELIAKVFSGTLKGVTSHKAPGPLITPDIVLMSNRVTEITKTQDFIAKTDLILGIEVKKLERMANGAVARTTGLDYNTTPPCGTIRVYLQTGEPLDIRGYYLFVCLEPAPSAANEIVITALVLCDGNALNADFDYYLSIVGAREKEIGIGTYKDGVNRIRPMVIFANPLGAAVVDRQVSLIHPDENLEISEPELKKVCIFRRTIPNEGYRNFYCYRMKNDVPSDWELKLIVDPFPTPSRRTITTQARGKFRLPYRFRS